MTKDLLKIVKELEKKWGVEAWNDLCDIIWKYQLRIENLTQSRDNWRKKYDDLKESISKG